MSSLSYDSCGDLRLVERSQLTESKDQARRQAVDLFLRIGSFARELDSLSSHPNPYTAGEMSDAHEAMSQELDLIHDHMTKLAARIKDMQQGEELVRGL